tara:strand:+ start:286 stop:639 length:354 start_codon:yes stop_codon:yes gene_type:complete
MRKVFLAIAAIGLVAACATTPATPTNVSNALAAKAKQDIKVKLRAPDSGQFQNFRAYKIANGETAVCASVNAQNAFGGMTGFKDTVVIYRGDQHIVFFDDPAVFECANLARGTSARM